MTITMGRVFGFNEQLIIPCAQSPAAHITTRAYAVQNRWNKTKNTITIITRKPLGLFGWIRGFRPTHNYIIIDRATVQRAPSALCLAAHTHKHADTIVGHLAIIDPHHARAAHSRRVCICVRCRTGCTPYRQNECGLQNGPVILCGVFFVVWQPRGAANRMYFVCGERDSEYVCVVFCVQQGACTSVVRARSLWKCYLNILRGNSSTLFGRAHKWASSSSSPSTQVHPFNVFVCGFV